MNDNFRQYSRQVSYVYCKDMADSKGSLSFSPATRGPLSSIDEFIDEFIEEDHSPRRRAYASPAGPHTTTSTTPTNASARVDKQTPFCKEVVLLNNPHDQTVLRGSRKAV